MLVIELVSRFTVETMAPSLMGPTETVLACPFCTGALRLTLGAGLWSKSVML